MDSRSFRATYPIVFYPRGLHTTAPRAKSGPRRHFVNNEKITSLQKLVHLEEFNISRTNHIDKEVTILTLHVMISSKESLLCRKSDSFCISLNDEYPALAKKNATGDYSFRYIVFVRSRIFCLGRDLNKILIPNKP